MPNKGLARIVWSRAMISYRTSQYDNIVAQNRHDDIDAPWYHDLKLHTSSCRSSSQPRYQIRQIARPCPVTRVSQHVLHLSSQCVTSRSMKHVCHGQGRGICRELLLVNSLLRENPWHDKSRQPHSLSHFQFRILHPNSHKIFAFLFSYFTRSWIPTFAFRILYQVWQAPCLPYRFRGPWLRCFHYP